MKTKCVISFFNQLRQPQKSRRTALKIPVDSKQSKLNLSLLVKIMAENIMENHEANTMEHELKTQGCLLKEIIRKIFVNSQFGNHVKETIFVHLRTIEDDRNVIRSVKTHHIINDKIPGNKTVETEMTSEEVIDFEKAWKKLWRPKMTPQEHMPAMKSYI